MPNTQLSNQDNNMKGKLKRQLNWKTPKKERKEKEKKGKQITHKKKRL